MSSTVVLLGTLDTKGVEYEYFRRSVLASGAEVILVDVGIGEPNGATPDIDQHESAREGGSSIDELRAAGDRAGALHVMAAGAARILGRLRSEGRLDGVAGLGGTGGSTLISQAMRALPVGVPKLLVSTVASGDTRPYVGDTDVTLMNSIVDIAGINRISRTIIGNAAGAIAGMAASEAPESSAVKTVVGATMFGLTTPCVTVAREYLEEQDYEVLVFHATGSGGRALEGLIDAGLVDAMLDVTTTELADNLVGGVFSAGPDRLTAAGRAGIPQVVSVGALDMVNFGAESTIPGEFRGRLFHRHNDTVTLMRTTPAENVALGREIAEKLNAATGPAALFFPMKGVSGIAVEGGTFHSPEADAALHDTLRENLSPRVEFAAVDTDINDPAFGRAMAERLHELIQQRTLHHDHEERRR
jgi:uncharacterized protein (UPF0261 family)